MTGKLELPRIEIWKAMNGIVREGWGEKEESVLDVVLEMPIRP